MFDEKNHPAIWRGDLEDKLGYDRPEWRKRMVALSAFISDEDKSVMDLGAGNLQLRRILNRNVKYYPVDCRKTSNDTIVCDFNKLEFPDQKVDVIFAAGILGYISDPEWFLTEISTHCRKLIISYKGRENYANQPLYTRDVISILNNLGFGITERDYSLAEWTLLACFEKITPPILSKQKYCAGCGACANACPADAIAMLEDENGYLKPYLDSQKCIACNKCVNTCPALHRPHSKNAYNTPLCYAAWAEDDIRSHSSSGGFFSVLSEYIISKGGMVFGAEWNKDFSCKIVGTNKIEGIMPMRYSKYVQSNTSSSFRETEKCLKEGRPVAYFGCPCEIAGLNNYLKTSGISNVLLENLITVDLVCFCAPSGSYFRKYLEENFGIKNVKNVNFRDKMGGWSPVSYKVELISGETIFPEFSNDAYQQAFHKVLARNDTCEECDYYRIPRQGDFSIGDFWGIEQHDTSWNDEKGTSLVLVNNEKAKTTLYRIKDDFERFEEVPLAYAENKGNRVDNSVRAGHPYRKYFQSIVKDMPFNDAVRDALNGYHEIGLVVLLNQNLGNNITNYALYQILTELGYRTLIIGKFDNQFVEATKENIYLRFLRKPYPDFDIAHICHDKADFIELNEKCKSFVTGSDQLFRATFAECSDYVYCQNWVSGIKYKFSYGTSFGCDKFEGSEGSRAKMAYYLSRFQNISVREKFGVELMREQFDLQAECVLDPVFLCDQKHYDDMIKIGRLRIPETKYVGAYLLDIDRKKIGVLNKVAESITNGKHLAITDYPVNHSGDEINILNEPSVEEWLALIHDSDFFITDSFHGICFAIIFKKQFAVVYNKENWRGYARIKDILERAGLEDRFLESTDDKSINRVLNSQVDYTKVDEKINIEKEHSLAWLKSALAEEDIYHGNYDLIDATMEICLSEKKIKDELTKAKSDIFLMTKMNVNIVNVKESRGKHMQVVGFGAGDCFRRNIDKIIKVYDLKYVVDNAPEKWGKDLGYGVKCISPKQLSEMSNVLVVIMVDSVKISFEIVDELRELGVINCTHITNWLDAIGD